MPMAPWTFTLAPRHPSARSPPGKKWYPWFRFYGPQKGIFDKSWKLPDIERAT